MLWPLHAGYRQPDWNECIWHLLPQAKSFSLPHCNISPADCNFLLFMFRISFVFLEILYFVTTFWSQFPVIIILVTGTHQYFIHNTLGGSKESPLPRKSSRPQGLFILPIFLYTFVCKTKGTLVSKDSLKIRARDGIRTRDPRLGKAILHH